MSDKHIDDINKAQSAFTVMQVAGPHIDRQINKVLTNLCTEYRNKTVNHTSLIGGIAQIEALNQLKRDLQRDIETGRKAAKEEIEDEPV